MYVDRIKDGILKPVTKETVVKETENTAVIDGNHGMGHVIAHRAMSLAIEKARRCNVGMVGVRNSTHFGITGYYPAMAVRENMAGLAFSNARPSVAPTFGVEPVIGTNPAFGAPSDEEYPFLLDIATSTTGGVKIEALRSGGQTTPKGLTIDREGKEPTDSTELLQTLVKGTASCFPGRGRRGAGEVIRATGWVSVEILCASFTGGSFGKALTGFNNGKPAFHRLSPSS